MNHSLKIYLLAFALVVINGWAGANTFMVENDSVKVKKERKKVLLKEAEEMVSSGKPGSPIRYLVDVLFEHEDILLYCDSAYMYNKKNSVEAFSNVHIIKSDTIHMYADFVYYSGDDNYAKARNNVTLQDQEITLFTDTLDFDMENDVGYYFNGGTIVDSTNTLTSIEAEYFTNKNMVHFKYNVKVDNEDYEVFADTLKYNTKTEVVYFDGETNIIGDSTTMYTEKGWFDTQNNVTQLYKNSKFYRGGNELFADSIFYVDSLGTGDALGNVILHDTNNSMIIKGESADYEDHTDIAVITDSAMFLHYNEGDTLFLHADTLKTMPDSIGSDEKLLTAFYNVRFYRKDLQGVSDSLNYYTKDSTIEMYIDPVAWSEENQLSANFIEFITNPEPPNVVNMVGNSFIIQEFDTEQYNQIKGKDMICFIRGKELYQIDVNGSGQSLYYPQEQQEDSSFVTVGANFAESSKIRLYLANNRINRINFQGAPDGVLNPLDLVSEGDKKLSGFKWEGEKRPLNRNDIFPRIAIDTTHVKPPVDSLFVEPTDSLAIPPEVKDTLRNEKQPRPSGRTRRPMK